MTLQLSLHVLARRRGFSASQLSPPPTASQCRARSRSSQDSLRPQHVPFREDQQVRKNSLVFSSSRMLRCSNPPLQSMQIASPDPLRSEKKKIKFQKVPGPPQAEDAEPEAGPGIHDPSSSLVQRFQDPPHRGSSPAAPASKVTGSSQGKRPDFCPRNFFAHDFFCPALRGRTCPGEGIGWCLPLGDGKTGGGGKTLKG
jgi:hypothetical protein